MPPSPAEDDYGPLRRMPRTWPPDTSPACPDTFPVEWVTDYEYWRLEDARADVFIEWLEKGMER
jgi:hypothetical protein